MAIPVFILEDKVFQKINRQIDHDLETVKFSISELKQQIKYLTEMSLQNQKLRLPS